MASAVADRRKTGGHTALLFGVAAAVVAVDQLSKTWAVRTLADREPIELVGSLQLALHYNTGASFSLGRNLGPIIGVLAVVVVVVLAISGRSARSRLTAGVIGLLIGGAAGNLVDRAFRSGVEGEENGFLDGAVVDFIDLQWWPVFNVADSAIVVGAIALALISLRGEPARHPPDAPAK